jgi:hypothetical protein
VISSFQESKTMFTKILIANRGDQLRSGAAAKPKRLPREACAGDFIAMETNDV